MKISASIMTKLNILSIRKPIISVVLTLMNGILNNTRNTIYHLLFSKDYIYNRQCCILNLIEWFLYDGGNHSSAFIVNFEQVHHINVVPQVQRRYMCVSVLG